MRTGSTWKTCGGLSQENSTEQGSPDDERNSVEYRDYEELAFERDGKILTVTINRPDVRNAVNERLQREFARVLLDIENDAETDVVILTGSGKAFSAGGDLDWIRGVHGDPVATSVGIRIERQIQNSLLDMEKPIIAKVRGSAIGLGCSLALFCDFVYATPETRFADPHVAVGLVAGDGGSLIWPQLIGFSRARRYLLTGDPISGKEAAELGLITAAVPEDQLDAEVAAMASRLAGGATYAIRWTKASINAGLKVLANAIIDRSAAYENLTLVMNDSRAALDAFQAKSSPVFTGS